MAAGDAQGDAPGSDHGLALQRGAQLAFERFQRRQRLGAVYASSRLGEVRDHQPGVAVDAQAVHGSPA